MKTTRAKLFEFMIKTSKEYGSQFSISNPWIELKFFADKLIEAGFVEIEEPREFWIKLRGLDIEATHSLPIYTTDPNAEIIHVHSVDQCKRYEKMWNQIKDDFRQFSSVTNRMEELENGGK